MPRFFFFAMTVLPALCLVGCGRKVVTIDNPSPLAAVEYDRVFDSAVAELRDRHFPVARQDRRFGIITSGPLIASTVIEPWHSDNSSGRQVAESTLNLDRRLVRVTLAPAEPIDPGSDQPPSRYLLGVEVALERHLNAPHELTTSNLGAAKLSKHPGRYQLRKVETERGVETGHWAPLGRDALLEQRLIDAIISRAAVVGKETGDKRQETMTRREESVAESVDP